VSMPVVATVPPARIMVPAGTTAGTALRDTGLPNKGPDAIVVVPATANVIAKMRAGIADDAASTTLVAAHCPVLVAPA